MLVWWNSLCPAAKVLSWLFCVVELIMPSCKSALLAVLFGFFAEYWVSSNLQTDTELLADHMINQAMVSMHSSFAQARDSGNRGGHTVE